MKKYFIITIDTEGDNVWNYVPNNNRLLIPNTENAKYIERFQNLCERYDFYPTYLADYEMVQSDLFCEFGKTLLMQKKGEIGMHMHAFSTPPFYKLSDVKGRGLAFAGEYPERLLFKKMQYMTQILEECFQVKMISHRGGRWYLDNRILNILHKLGYLVDCTVTPGINWEQTKGQTGKSKGSNYTKYISKPYRVKNTQLWELPVTIYSKMKIVFGDNGLDIIKNKLWMRANGKNINEMKKIVRRNMIEPVGYLEFMLHSSELMPGANPTFQTKKQIDDLYVQLDDIFSYLYEKGYQGITCSSYAKEVLNNKYK